MKEGRLGLTDEASFDLDLFDIFRDVWRFRVVTLTFMLLSALLGVSLALWLPRQYVAHVTVVPVSTPSTSGIGGLTSQYSGVLALAGVTLSGSSDVEEARAMLKSELLVRRYVEENGLLQVIYADRWDDASRSWNSKRPVPSIWKAPRRRVDSLSMCPALWLAMRVAPRTSSCAMGMN